MPLSVILWGILLIGCDQAESDGVLHATEGSDGDSASPDPDDTEKTFEDLISPSTEAVGSLSCIPDDGDWLVSKGDPMLVDEATFEFTLQSPFHGTLAHAVVEVSEGDGEPLLGAAVADAEGRVTVQAQSCAPLDVRVSTEPGTDQERASWSPQAIWPPAPSAPEVHAMEDVSWQVSTGMVGVDPLPGSARVIGRAMDCERGVLENVQVIVVDDEGVFPQALEVHYWDDAGTLTRLIDATSSDGRWIAFNVPEGQWWVEMWALVDSETSLVGRTPLRTDAESAHFVDVHAGHEGPRFPDGCEL